MQITHSTPPDAPKPHGVRQPWPELIAELKKSPGEWFELTDLGYAPRMVQVTASRIRTGALKVFRDAGTFETRHDYKSIWIRFVS